MRLLIVTVLWSMTVSVVMAATPHSCIQVVPGGAVELFWQQVKRGALDAGRDLGYSIYFRGAKTSSHAQEQQKIVNMIGRLGCKALVVAPSMNYDEFVAQTEAQGIPVIYIDRMAGQSNLIDLVATDNYAAGQAAGRYMAEQLGGQGRVVLLRLQKGISSTDLREQGFIDAATASGLTIVHDSYIGDDVAKGRVLARSALTSLKGQFDGIFTPNETTTTSVLLALEHLPGHQRLVNVGFDMSHRLLEGVINGRFSALIAQRPYRIGYDGVKVAVLRAQHQGAPRQTDTGYLVISKAALASGTTREELTRNYPELTQMLEPGQSQ